MRSRRICCYLLLLVSLLSAAQLASAGSPAASNFTVRCDVATLVCQPGFQNQSFGVLAATASNDAQFQTTGWNSVVVTADPNLTATNPALAFFAAGYAEGYLTQYDIHTTWVNLMIDTVGPDVSYNRSAFDATLQAHYNFLLTFNVSDPDRFQRQVAKLMAQVQGVAAGYNASWEANGKIAEQQRTAFEIFLINMQPEIGEWMKATADGPRIAGHGHLMAGAAAMKAAPIKRRDQRPFSHDEGRCSVLIRNTGDDLFVGHTTWWRYKSMYRQFKTYTLEGTTVAMSAYPGLISSMDDFYFTSKGLIVTETTLWVFNDSLYPDILESNTISEFLRVMGANYISDSAPEWIQHFSRLNSGTYCSQYMVADTKLFTPNQPVPANTLWIAEQLPGNITSGDMSNQLNSPGYWVSYNYPVFSNVLEVSGDNAYRSKYGFVPDFGRMTIFPVQAPLVKDLDTMQAAMRYNNYLHDPLSRIPNCTGAVDNRCSPAADPSAWMGISARGDLVPIYTNKTLAQNALGNLWMMFNGHLSGGSDSKVTSYRLLNYSSIIQGQSGMTATIINGPTTSNGLPPFRWSNFIPSVVSERPLEHPDMFNFSWISVANGVQTKYTSPTATTAPSSGKPSTVAMIVAGAIGGLVAVTVIIVVLHQRTKARRHANSAADEVAVNGDDYKGFIDEN
jgi:hypothetical protein